MAYHPFHPSSLCQRLLDLSASPPRLCGRFRRQWTGVFAIFGLCDPPKVSGPGSLSQRWWDCSLTRRAKVSRLRSHDNKKADFAGICQTKSAVVCGLWAQSPMPPNHPETCSPSRPPLDGAISTSLNNLAWESFLAFVSACWYHIE